MRLVSMLVLALLLVGCGAGGGAASLTPDKVIAGFKAAGLQAETPRPMQVPADYGLAPLVAKEGKRFSIPSLGGESGGRVFVFDSADKRDQMKAYYDKLGEASAAFYSWTFARDLVLVQINGSLPEPEARKYEAALAGLK